MKAPRALTWVAIRAEMPQATYAERIAALAVNLHLAGKLPSSEQPLFVSEGGWAPRPRSLKQAATVIATVTALRTMTVLADMPEEERGAMRSRRLH